MSGGGSPRGFSDAPKGGFSSDPVAAAALAGAQAAALARGSGMPPPPPPPMGSMPLQNDPNSRFSEDPSEDPMTVSLRIAFAMRRTPRENRKVYVPHEPGVNFMGLLLGPRGATLKDMIDRTGAKIVIRGKGSQREGPGAFQSPAHEDDNDEMHVAIEGAADSVQRAASEVEQILNNPQARQQLRNTQGGEMSQALTVGRGAAPGLGSGGGGGGFAGMGGDGPGWQVTPFRAGPGEVPFECRVPNSMVGLIIGRGGENIKRIQTECVVRLQIARDPEPPEESQGQPGMRRIAMTGAQQSIDRAKAEIDDLIRTRGASMAGGGMVGPGGPPMLQFKIPNDKVGLVIGRQGSTVRGIQERTRTNVRIPPNPDVDDPNSRTLAIVAENAQDAAACRAEIEQLVSDEIIRNGGPVPTGASSYYPVPETVVGLIIGKGGETINKLQQGQGVRIQVPNSAEPGSNPPVRLCVITGPDECRQRAQFEISQILSQHAEMHKGGGGYGGGGQGMVDPYAAMSDPYAQPQQQGGYADPYAGMMMDPYAQQQQQMQMQQQMQQQQMHQQMQQQQMQQQQPQESDPAALAPDAYYQDFWNYAGWYGEDAARATYQAYAPPPGTAPPPGVVMPDPAAAAAALQQQQQQQQEAASQEPTAPGAADVLPPGTVV